VDLLGVLVIHDAIARRQHEATELTARQQHVAPLLNLVEVNVEARRNHTGLVDAADQLDDDLARAVVVDDFELTDVACERKNKK
jgi:hypothetical protein